MGQFDTSLGAFLVGTWANMGLYFLEIMQVVTLFRRYPNDPLILKAVVLFSFIVDTACTIAECATVYTYTVTFWGNPAGLANQIWAGPAYVFTTALSAAIVHAFLIFRFYTLSKQTALAVLLVCFALAAFSGGLWAFAGLIIYPGVNERGELVTPAMVWFIATCTTDVALALALWIMIRKMRAATPFRSTQSMLRRLAKMTVQTGAATTFFALATLAVFLQNHRYNVADAMNFCLGRIYTHTMLHNLHARRTTRDLGAGGSGSSDFELSAPSSNGTRSTGTTARPVAPAPRVDLSQGISVSRSVHIVQEAAPDADGKAPYEERDSMEWRASRETRKRAPRMDIH